MSAEFSMHIDEGNGRSYMSTVVADNARQAIERMVYRISPDAETASIEVLEVLSNVEFLSDEVSR